MRKSVVFTQATEAVKIPEGKNVTVEDGTEGFIVQTRGGNITIRIPDKIWQVQLPGEKIDVLETPEGEPVELDLDPTETIDYDDVPEDMEEAVYQKLQECYDPEIPVNIVQLGLVYGVDVEELPDEQYKVDVDMTLTAPGCGMGSHIAGEAERKINSIPGVKHANVDIVWDPPWTEDMMSDEAREELGMA